MKLNPRITKAFVYLIVVAGLCSCGSNDYVPKPRGYNRIELQNPNYITLPDTFPYQFEYSDKARILKDSSYIAEPYWVHLYYPELAADIQLTYKNISSQKDLEEYLGDSYRL